ESQAIVFAFLSAPASQGSWLISSACSAVLVGAHYRELNLSGKQKHCVLLRKTLKCLIDSQIVQDASIYVLQKKLRPPFTGQELR
ncbi:TPA: hypothetical protein ACNV64_004316, partial [Aeromonas salmonicida subsp. pectinolytica]